MNTIVTPSFTSTDSPPIEVLYTGSSTTWMQQRASHLTLKLCYAKQAPFTAHEALFFTAERGFIREAWMGDQEKGWMFARSACLCAADGTPALSFLSTLAQRPLGDIIAQQQAPRSPFHVQTIDASALPLFFGTAPAITAPHTLWLRYSYFVFKEGTLLLTEVFLPDYPFL